MPAATTLSAEQAAHAIALLSSNHATASDYMYSMDGEGMSRSEFREYLRLSSQSEYLELLNGHLPDECADLARRAATIQEKRKQKGESLHGSLLSKDTAKQFFTTLELEKSQGLRFKDVRKALKSMNLPNPANSPIIKQSSEAAHADSTPVKADNQREPGVESTPAVDDSSVEGEAKKSKIRKELRQQAFEKYKQAQEKKEKRKQVRTAQRSAAATDSIGNGPADGQRIAESGETQPSKASLQNVNVASEGASNKRKRGSSPVSDVSRPQGDGKKENNKRKRRREKKRKLELEARANTGDRDAAFLDEVASAIPGDEDEAGDGTERINLANGTQGIAQNSHDTSSNNVIAQNTMRHAPLTDEGDGDSAMAGNSEATKSAKRKTKRGKHKSDSSKLERAESQTQSHDTAEDVALESARSEEAQAAPAPSAQANDAVEDLDVESPRSEEAQVVPAPPAQETDAKEDLDMASSRSEEEQTGPARTKESDVAEDVEMESLMSEDEQTVPAPTQETADFVSAVEPEDPFNNHTESDNSHSTDIFRVGRTMLPLVEAKVWKSASPQSSPSYLSSKTSPNVVQTTKSDLPIEERAPVPNPESGYSVNLKSQPGAGDCSDASADRSDDDSVGGNELDSFVSAADGELKETLAKDGLPPSAQSSHKPELLSKAFYGSSPASSMLPGKIGLHSSLGSMTSCRSSLSLGSLGFPSVMSLFGSTQAKANSIPSHAVHHDPQVAIKNLNKFLNNGNSSDESEDDDSDSSSDDEDGSPQPSKPQAVTPQAALGKDVSLRKGKSQQSIESPPAHGHQSFGSYVEGDSRTSHQLSPSPDVPDLPALMEQGGYIPRYSSGGDTSSRPPTSGTANGTSTIMEVDLLSPFKNRDPAQGSAQGIVRPSEIIEYSSSPPLRGAPITNEVDADGIQSSLDQPSIVDTASELEEHGDAEDVKEEEAVDAGETSVVISLLAELERQDEEYRRSSASFLATPASEHNTDDDQAAASSQLLGEASAEPPSQRSGSNETTRSVPRKHSPQVIIHVPAGSNRTSPQQGQLGEISQESTRSGSSNTNETEVPNTGSQGAGPEESDLDKDDIHEDDADDDTDQEHSEKDEEESSTSSESKAESDPDGKSDDESEDEEDEAGQGTIYNSDDPPDSPSSMEWDPDKQGDGSEYEEELPPASTETSSNQKRKTTGTTSRHFSISPVKKTVKRIAGVSSVPFPKLSAPRFGLIQETLCHIPFHMLCAVLFLNKTNGHVAKEIILQVIEKWPTPEALSKADPKELLTMIERLGLQNERTKKLIKLAEIFVADPPAKGRRHRTLHYPNADDGKHTSNGKRTSPKQVLEEDSDDINGFLEIGHLYGAGPYAWDSWRIFCRDVLRGVAEGYNGEGVEGYNASDPQSQCTFEPEWKRVIPKDKELRACLRWMWLREGWDWDPLTGDKRPASIQKIRAASQGIAEWTEPVPFNPHGIELEGTVKAEASPDAIVPGVDAGDVVLETTEIPQQGFREENLRVESPMTKITSQDSTQSMKPLSQQTTQDSQGPSQQETHDANSPQSSLSVRGRKRALEDADLPPAKIVRIAGGITTTAAESQIDKLSPRSVRKLKASFIADYNASLQGGIEFPITQSQPSFVPRSPMDSPAKNTRQKSSRAIESNITSSPIKASREKAQLPNKATTRVTRSKTGSSAGANSRLSSADSSSVSFVSHTKPTPQNRDSSSPSSKLTQEKLIRTLLPSPPLTDIYCFSLITNSPPQPVPVVARKEDGQTFRTTHYSYFDGSHSHRHIVAETNDASYNTIFTTTVQDSVSHTFLLPSPRVTPSLHSSPRVISSYTTSVDRILISDQSTTTASTIPNETTLPPALLKGIASASHNVSSNNASPDQASNSLDSDYKTKTELHMGPKRDFPRHSPNYPQRSLLVKAKPGFFDPIFDTTYLKHNPAATRDPAYDLTPEETNLKLYRSLARALARDHGFKNVAQMTRAHGTVPSSSSPMPCSISSPLTSLSAGTAAEAVKEQKQAHPQAKEIISALHAAEAAVRAQRALDPVEPYRLAWSLHYPQDRVYAAEACKCGFIQRSRAKAEDVDAWKRLRKVAGMEGWFSGCGTVAHTYPLLSNDQTQINRTKRQRGAGGGRCTSEKTTIRESTDEQNEMPHNNDSEETTERTAFITALEKLNDEFHARTASKHRLAFFAVKVLEWHIEPLSPCAGASTNTSALSTNKGQASSETSDGNASPKQETKLQTGIDSALDEKKRLRRLCRAQIRAAEGEGEDMKRVLREERVRELKSIHGAEYVIKFSDVKDWY